MRQFIEFLEKQRRRKIIKFLCSADPEIIEKIGKDSLIPAFGRAATKVPAYQKILKEHGVSCKDIKDIEAFKKAVPIIDKNSTFGRFEIEELCAGKNLKEMKLAMSSSGFSGTFAFGINTYYNQKKIAQSIDTALDYVFDISNRKTFLLSCIPMGVKVYTSLKIAETSTRSDMALAIIKKFSSKFEQTLIVGEIHFLKKLVEEGNEEGIDWKRLNVSLILGEDWFSESYRSYLAHLVDIDLNNQNNTRFVGATLGIAELDLNLFHETADTINIRRKLQNDERFRKAAFGNETKIAPIIYHYYPHRMFLEAIPENSNEKELVFSMLSPHMLIPLMRYNSKDRGWIFSYNKMKEILSNSGYGSLAPELKLPLVAVGGRKDRVIEVQGKKVYPEEIKQGLYEDFEAASLTTGYFKLNRQKTAIEIQLKKGITITEDIKRKFEKALLKYSSIAMPVALYHYQDFPYAMELDYERKFHHV